MGVQCNGITRLIWRGAPSTFLGKTSSGRRIRGLGCVQSTSLAHDGAREGPPATCSGHLPPFSALLGSSLPAPLSPCGLGCGQNTTLGLGACSFEQPWWTHGVLRPGGPTEPVERRGKMLSRCLPPSFSCRCSQGHFLPPHRVTPPSGSLPGLRAPGEGVPARRCPRSTVGIPSPIKVGACQLCRSAAFWSTGLRWPELRLSPQGQRGAGVSGRFL